MSQSIKAVAEPIRTVAGTAGGITAAAYLPLQNWQGIAPLSHPPRLIHVQNLTDVPVLISYQLPGSPTPPVNGSQDHFILNSQSFVLLDIASNSALPSGEFYIPQGSTFYVRAQSASTATGAVWLAVIYGQLPSGQFLAQ
jgi:hypothetical protein